MRSNDHINHSLRADFTISVSGKGEVNGFQCQALGLQQWRGPTSHRPLVFTLHLHPTVLTSASEDYTDAPQHLKQKISLNIVYFISQARNENTELRVRLRKLGSKTKIP